MDILGGGGALQAIVALIFVLALAAIIFYAVRRFGGGTIDTAVKGKRQPRLGVIDSAFVDQRRKLVIVRRDNVEHLLMIGGATDLVIETNIVRAGPVQGLREAPLRAVEDIAPAAVEEVRPPPAPERRLQAQAKDQTEATTAWPLQPAVEAAPVTEPPVIREMPIAELRPTPSPPKLSKSEDQNLAEMAQRLEAALRRPIPAVEAQPPAPSAPQPAPSASPATLGGVTRDAERLPPQADEKGVFESLEQEMASLLGRPTNKT